MIKLAIASLALALSACTPAVWTHQPQDSQRIGFSASKGALFANGSGHGCYVCPHDPGPGEVR